MTISFEKSHTLWIDHMTTALCLNTNIDPQKVRPHKVLDYDQWAADDHMYSDNSILPHRHYLESEDKVYHFVNADIQTFDDWFKQL